jgi:hypothetical protein
MLFQPNFFNFFCGSEKRGREKGTRNVKRGGLGVELTNILGSLYVGVFSHLLSYHSLFNGQRAYHALPT